MPYASAFDPRPVGLAIVTSGTSVIPAGSAVFSIHVISGGAYVNGVGPIAAPTSLRSDIGSTIDLSVGVTGGNTVVFWQK